MKNAAMSEADVVYLVATGAITQDEADKLYKEIDGRMNWFQSFWHSVLSDFFPSIKQ